MIIPLFNGPRSLSGHSLAGDQLVNFIFVDEAGVSVGEPIAVVASVVVSGDAQWRCLEEHLSEIRKKYLPPEDREDFVFHATELFSGGRYFKRDSWPLKVRLSILRDILSAGWKFELAVSIGFAARVAEEPDDGNHAVVRHGLAYVGSLSGCEAYFREFGKNDEVAMVIAENTEAAKSLLKHSHKKLSKDGFKFKSISDLVPFRHIKDGVLFAQKSESALLQYADAFAFAFRRHLGGYSHSDQLISNIIGPSDGGIGEFSINGNQGYKLILFKGSLRTSASFKIT